MKVQQHDGSIVEMDKSDPASLDVLNHSTSHLLAEAIQVMYPNALFGFGPAIEEGFYYDIDFGDTVITDEDLPKIEKKMKELDRVVLIKDRAEYQKAGVKAGDKGIVMGAERYGGGGLRRRAGHTAPGGLKGRQLLRVVVRDQDPVPADALGCDGGQRVAYIVHARNMEGNPGLSAEAGGAVQCK